MTAARNNRSRSRCQLLRWWSSFCSPLPDKFEFARRSQCEEREGTRGHCPLLVLSLDNGTLAHWVTVYDYPCLRHEGAICRMPGRCRETQALDSFISSLGLTVRELPAPPPPHCPDCADSGQTPARPPTAPAWCEVQADAQLC